MKSSGNIVEGHSTERKKQSVVNPIVEEMDRQLDNKSIEFIASWIIQTATSATKSINTKDNWIEIVPDHKLRYKAIRDMATMNWWFLIIWRPDEEFTWETIFTD